MDVLRPARAAEWVTALLEAADDVPAAERTHPLGLAAALAVGLGESDRAAGCLQLLGRGGALGQVIAAALSTGADAPPEEQIDSLSPQERDWVVLQCYRAGRQVPPALAVRLDSAALAALDQLTAIEELAHAALACNDPDAVVTGFSDWLSRADSDGIDYFIQRDVLAPVCRTMVRLGMRGWVEQTRPEQLGLLLRDCIDSEYRSEMTGEFVELADRLMQLGYHVLVVRLAEESSGWGRYYDDIALAALLRHDRHEEAMSQFAGVLADRALRPPSRSECSGVLPVTTRAFAPPVVHGLLDVARAAPPSSARTGSMAQIAVLTAKTGDPDGDLADLVAEVRALIEPRASTDRWAAHPHSDSGLINYETMAAVSALLDLALAIAATDKAQGLALIREALELADPDGPLAPIDRGHVNRRVAQALGQLPDPPHQFSEEERVVVEAEATHFTLGLLEQGSTSSPAIASILPEWVRTRALQMLATQGRWAAAIEVATAGKEKFWWVRRLGYLAQMCAALDEPEALGAVLAAVESLPLSEQEIRTARGMILRDCVFAESWSW